MKKNGLIVAILVIAILSSLFGAGGTQPARADVAMLDDVAGISAWTVYQCLPTELVPCPTIDSIAGTLASVEVQGTDYVIGSVAIEGYASEYSPNVFVALDTYTVTDETEIETEVTDIWIMAYYLEDEPAAKMIDVIAQPLPSLDPLVTAVYPTLLEQALGTVGVAVGIDPLVDPIEISYYDFSNPLATDMLLVAEDKAEDEGLLGDDDAWFTITMPDGEYYETSYGFYQNYYPTFSLDGVNFVLTSADYIGSITDGTIYGALDTVFIPDTSYLFEVDTMSLAEAGYGALLITYNDVVDEFVIESADWVEEFALVAPPAGLTDLFTFDFAPADFAKSAPTDDATGVGATVTLSWGESAGASFEYCIDEIAGTECETGWVSTTALSATLSGLPYNATYYWQVRAVNSYETTEADGGVWWSFSTIVGAPAAFSKLSPANGASGVATSPLLDWADAEGAESYEYCIAKNTEDCVAWVNTGLVSQAVVSLSLDTEYKWQVRAVNSEGATYADADVDWSFTTVAESFDKTSPVDEATGVDPKVNFEWDPMSGATGYQYCVSTKESCSRWTSAGAATTATVKGLKYETTYYWQVRAVTATGTIDANEGDWWTFTTRARKAPIKPVPSFGKTSPVDGAIGQVVENLVLDWEDVQDATSYAYCFDISDDDTCYNWIKTDVSTVTIPALAYETIYYWQVRATVSGIVGYADDGAYWSFMTMDVPEEPDPYPYPTLEP